MNDFPKYGKTHRLYDDILITEKLDGTNGLIQVKLVEEPGYRPLPGETLVLLPDTTQVTVRAGSRERWLTSEKRDDNYGFARWVEENADMLALLGEGHHYGEWWGNGIQRKYGMAEKRFSLFNPFLVHQVPAGIIEFVPILYQGLFSHTAIQAALRSLAYNGSQAAPGFMQAEGIIVRLMQARVNLKVIIDGQGEKREDTV